MGLTTTPKVELSATSGVKDVAFGASGAYDAAKGSVSSWSAGASLTRPDFQASAVLLDLGKTIKLGYAHNVDAATVAGAEVTRALDGGAETVFAVRFFFPLLLLSFLFFSCLSEIDREEQHKNSSLSQKTKNKSQITIGRLRQEAPLGRARQGPRRKHRAHLFALRAGALPAVSPRSVRAVRRDQPGQAAQDGRERRAQELKREAISFLFEGKRKGVRKRERKEYGEKRAGFLFSVFWIAMDKNDSRLLRVFVSPLRDSESGAGESERE